VPWPIVAHALKKTIQRDRFEEFVFCKEDGLAMKRVSAREKAMRAVPLCGPRVVARLRSIGIYGLQDLKGKDPHILMHQVNHAVGKLIWRPPMAIQALRNLVEAANKLPTNDRAENDPP
jgi:hypothetical protein